jgi:hypothetical protein
MFDSKTNIFWILLFVSSFSFGQQAQFTDLDNLAGKLIRSLRSEIAENIFIHTDKSVYKVGETIWLNAYLVNKQSHKISHQSQVVFIDLVNEKDSVISQLVLDARSLRLDGSIQLPVVLQDGNYWLRGYTNNILQTDSSDICVHPIYVVNPQNISSVKSDANSVNADTSLTGIPKFEIYPEGGSLIAGASSVVAFRVTDQNNNPLDVSGYVKDNHDTITTSFKTSLPGVGKFVLFPWKIRKYTVYLKTKENKVFSFPLPPATDNYAACLSVVGENEKSFRVRVLLGDSLYDKKTVTYILGISRDSLCFAGVGERMYETEIPKKNFPQGQATLLLFDQQRHLLSERSIYVDFNSTIVNMKADKENYLARQNAVLNFSVTDADNHPELSLLSISITDNNTVKYFYDEDIETVMKKPYSTEEKDLIMLVQKNKYRKWGPSDSTQLVKDSRVDENFFKTGGMVLDKKNQPMANSIVTLFTTQNQGIFKIDTTDEKGHFDFNLPGYPDTTQFMLQVSDRKGKILEAKIILDSTLLPKFKTPLYLKKPLPANATVEILQKKAEKQDFLLSGKGKELKEVIVRTRVKKPVNYNEQKRVSQFSRVITSDIIERAGFGSIGNVLFMIPGARLMNGRLVFGGSTTDSPIREPAVVMDDVMLDSNAIASAGGLDGTSPLITFLNSLSPRYIDFIEVLSGPEGAFYGVRGANGVIVIHTLSQMRDNYSNKTNALKKFSPVGFSAPALFTEPDYNKKEVRKNNSPDQRSTIYWNGPVITDDNGKATINFFTADPNTTYTVTVKGITASGDIFLKRFMINRN